MSTETKKENVVIFTKRKGFLSDLHKVLVQLRYNVQYAYDVETFSNLRKNGLVDMLVLDLESFDSDNFDLCQQIKSSNSDEFLPILVITEKEDFQTRIKALEMGADDYISRPFHIPVLSARLRSLLRLRNLTGELQKKNEHVSYYYRKLQARYESLNLDLKLAQKLQKSLLPRTLPEVNGIKFSALSMASGHVAGDFYDVFRLDENHFGFYVADAIGHGVRAALLTVFLKKGIVPKQISGNSYRIVPPDEVLQQLNADIIDADLSDTPFISMCYCLINMKTRKLSVSVAGHPSPILISKQGQISSVDPEGPILGVFKDLFETKEVELKNGDKILLYSDGVDVSREYNGKTGLDSFLNFINDSRNNSLKNIITDVQHAIFPAENSSELSDDITLLGLELQ